MKSHISASVLILVSILFLILLFLVAASDYHNICLRLGSRAISCPSFGAYVGYHSEIIFMTIGGMALIILGIVWYVKDWHVRAGVVVNKRLAYRISLFKIVCEDVAR